VKEENPAPCVDTAPTSVRDGTSCVNSSCTVTAVEAPSRQRSCCSGNSITTADTVTAAALRFNTSDDMPHPSGENSSKPPRHRVPKLPIPQVRNMGAQPTLQCVQESQASSSHNSSYDSESGSEASDDAGGPVDLLTEASPTTGGCVARLEQLGRQLEEKVEQWTLALAAAETDCRGLLVFFGLEAPTGPRMAGLSMQLLESLAEFLKQMRLAWKELERHKQQENKVQQGGNASLAPSGSRIGKGSEKRHSANSHRGDKLPKGEPQKRSDAGSST